MTAKLLLSRKATSVAHRHSRRADTTGDLLPLDRHTQRERERERETDRQTET